ncbi:MULTISPECIES: excinuclease ABC subunit UvrA [Selenomonas]|uniref:UvrABC system protein A n=1 Tax=Selenomonas ruminis TaxID=2593411 RepID=A0A5D6W6D8_9FIRM|nr:MULTISPECIES: excinuclease ABC subunit UvrA [unclassified Selenomonas]MBQ1867623.1 excinuclease ABC subunit UvrA [Selenomonas sp.]TYZ22559.1 excinuclease ABC subunit UvrA [Selenomonas sp. mPRGC5]
MEQVIKIKGARAHNLKNINVEIPRDKLVVITGLSGSGKSSLAFDTIYAEGQRRYVESLSSYARQFLGQMDKPDVDNIEGLSPAISIDQKTTSHNPRSTVGTVTEIYDYLRLLYARAGRPHCPKCGKPITQQTVDQMIDQIRELPERTKLLVMAQVIRGKKGEHKKVLEHIRREGYVRVRIDGEVHDVNDEIQLEKTKKHTIEVVIDRLVVREGMEQRLADSLETALKLGEGVVYVQIVDGELLMFSENFACVDCGISLPEITPRMFSFNSPYGACPVCMGLGSHMEFDEELVVPDVTLSVAQGVFAPLSKNPHSYGMCVIAAVLTDYGYTVDTPWKDMDKKTRQVLLHGAGDEKFRFHYTNMFGERKEYNVEFEGVLPMLNRRYQETDSDEMRESYENYMTEIDCPVCHGARLKPETLSITVGDKNIAELTAMTIREADTFLAGVAFTPREQKIAVQILKEIHARLSFLLNVGLDYLTLSRAAGTLSGGEAQRIRLATQIGSGLQGVLYVLDEPSIGLHQRDNNRLLATLKNLRDLGNTLIVVEHDEDTMYAADHIIDIGPGAGAHGGQIVAQGTAKEIMKVKESVTGAYLSRRKFIPVPGKRRPGNGKFIEVIGAQENNLKNIDVKFPLGTMTLVTGVSGSGKSTLVNEILYKGIASRLYHSKGKPGKHKKIKGLEHIDKIIDIDQQPIGRTPRSNPATYTGVFDAIRELFSQTAESKMRGYKAGRFSFNVKGGRCEACKGDGILKIEMHFLPDVYVPCEVCKGARYNRETLEVRYKGKNISEVLEMTIDEAVEFFQNVPRIARKLKVIQDVGLGYIKLGQPATTLSGGEAQRVKLATELSRRSTGRTLYILDEPTTGLHTADIHKLLNILQRLVDGGDTVVIIEHNLDVIKTADHIIDLGPEGGNKGGTIVAEGRPEDIVKVNESYTGKFLKPLLEEKND